MILWINCQSLCHISQNGDSPNPSCKPALLAGSTHSHRLQGQSHYIKLFVFFVKKCFLGLKDNIWPFSTQEFCNWGPIILDPKFPCSPNFGLWTILRRVVVTQVSASQSDPIQSKRRKSELVPSKKNDSSNVIGSPEVRFVRVVTAGGSVNFLPAV